MGCVPWTTSEVSASTPTSGRLQPRKGEMAQDGGTRGGTFHGEMDRCSESQGWTTACSSMPKRDGDGKDQGEDSPKQASSCWFTHHSLISHKWRELVSSGRLVCRCYVVFLWCNVYSVLLRFLFFCFTEAATLRSIFFVLRYPCVPTATHVPSFFLLFFLGVALFELFCTITVLFLCDAEYVERFPLPGGVFIYLVTRGLDFLHKLISM